jgi:Fur family ferric uptake transcriptional regulator
MKPVEKEIIAKLRQRGYKLTPQRRAVLSTITTSREHLTPSAIYERVQQEYPGIGLVTIYRTIDILAELGAICKLNAEGSSRSYLIRRDSGHHHHLICSGCGAVVDFTMCELRELEQRLSHRTGFKIEGHLLEFVGRCQKCQETTST